MKKDTLFKIIGSAFGLGLAPVAPGSFGALLGLAYHLAVVNFAPESAWQSLVAVGFFVFFVAHVQLNEWAAVYWNDPDSKNFVIDEVVGYLVIPVIYGPAMSWQQAVIAFLLFRVIDVIKVPPARKIDREMKDVWGVVFDDMIAASYVVMLLIGWDAVTCLFF